MGSTTGRPARRRRRLKIAAGSIVAALLVILLAFNLSPWPGAMVIRYVFERGAANVKVAMDTHIPGGVAIVSGERYREGDKDALLDVYTPESIAGTDQRLPTLVWTHGGAWISGHRTDASPYFQLIATEGFTVISLDYSLGPEKTYPEPVHQVNAALAYIVENADRFNVDPDRIRMAGDSAGSQITSQFAALTTNPDYAKEMDITPALRPEQLRGVVLFCGI